MLYAEKKRLMLTDVVAGCSLHKFGRRARRGGQCLGRLDHQGLQAGLSRFYPTLEAFWVHRRTDQVNFVGGSLLSCPGVTCLLYPRDGATHS